jgi:hypothetical protein
MKQWRCVVVATYTQELLVEAESAAEAKATAKDWFDPMRCHNTAELDVVLIDGLEIKGE